MREDRQRLVYDVLRRHARGESIRSISRSKGIARKTVKRIIRGMQKRRDLGDDAQRRSMPAPRAPKPSKLDPFEKEIGGLLERYPEITAQRLLEELKLLGFDGGYTIVRERLRGLRPKASKKAYDPLVLEPGKQGQADWSPYRLLSGELFNAFSVLLHFSRYQYVGFSRDRTRISLFRRLREAFEDFEGVPLELVFDSEKSVVDRWEMGEPRVNLEMLDFAAFYGFIVHIAPRANPEYKGGVERIFRHLVTNFFNARRFSSFEEACEALRWWQHHRANRRVHARLRERPIDRLELEREALQPLPKHPYDCSEIGWRIVDGYHRVAYETNTYSVPPRLVGECLCVRASEHELKIYDRFATPITSHSRAPRGARVDREKPEHRKRRHIDIPALLEVFDGWGEAAGEFARRLRQKRRYAGAQLNQIVELRRRYRLEDLLQALEHALLYSAHEARSVERILEATAEALPIKDIVAEHSRARIRETLVGCPVEQRRLSEYQKLLSPNPGEAEEEDESCEHDPES